MAANNDSPRSPPFNEQVPNNQRLGFEIPLGLPKHMPQQEMTPSPVVPDEDHDHYLGLYNRVDVEALDEWAHKFHERKHRIRCTGTRDY